MYCDCGVLFSFYLVVLVCLSAFISALEYVHSLINILLNIS